MSSSFLPERSRPRAAPWTGAWTPGERLAGRSADPDPLPGAPTIGVLALQGDVIEHVRALRRCGSNVVQVRTVSDLGAVEGIVVPGGESTTIGKLLARFGLLEPLRSRIRDGMPAFGTCAGMILLSDELDQSDDQPLIGGLHVRTRRNAFGGQVHSFDTRIEVAGIAGGPLDVAFIRAPRVEAVLDDEVEVLAEVADHPIERLRELGFAVTLNTDNRLMSGVTATSEAATVVEAFGYGIDDLEELASTAVDHAFLDVLEREELADRVARGYAALRP